MMSKNLLERRVERLENLIANTNKKKFEFADAIDPENVLLSVKDTLDDSLGPNEMEDGTLVVSLNPDMADHPRDYGYAELYIEDFVCYISLFDDEGVEYDADEVEVDLVKKSFHRDVAKILDTFDKLCESNEYAD